MILKPSEKSPLSAIRLAGLAKEAGLPDGVLNVVTGFGHEAGQALSRHNDIDAIAFTGSTRTGKQLLKDAGDSNMKRVWLEAGGKSANLVFADCPDLQKAASATAAGISFACQYIEPDVSIIKRMSSTKSSLSLKSGRKNSLSENLLSGGKKE